MADRYLIENREAAVGVHVFHTRQRWGAAVWRAQTQVLALVGQSMHVLYRGGKGLRRAVRAADTAAEASWRSHASGAGNGGRWGARRRRLGCWVRRRRGSRRPAIERLGERRRPRAWSGPAGGRSVFWGVGVGGWVGEGGGVQAVLLGLKASLDTYQYRLVSLVSN
jgi:hypothetical protein